MKFIFPKNYNFKNKIFGIIDYSTALVNIIWYAFIFLLINLLFYAKVLYFQYYDN